MLRSDNATFLPNLSNLKCLRNVNSNKTNNELTKAKCLQRHILFQVGYPLVKSFVAMLLKRLVSAAE